MAVAPNLMDKVIDYVSFAFVYNNNSNTMKISNSMLNIISYPVKFESDTVEDSSTEKEIQEILTLNMMDILL